MGSIFSSHLHPKWKELGSERQFFSEIDKGRGSGVDLKFVLVIRIHWPDVLTAQLAVFLPVKNPASSPCPS